MEPSAKQFIDVAQAGAKWLGGHPPIHTFWWGPYLLEAPERILLPRYRSRPLLFADASIANRSARVLHDVRIKLPFKPDFAIESASGMSDERWMFDEATLSIKVPALDPDETASFRLYVTPDQARKGEAEFLFEGQRVSWVSNNRGLFWRVGWRERLMLLVTGGLLVVVACLAYVGYGNMAEGRRVQALLDQAGFRATPMRILTQADGSLNYAGLIGNACGGVQGAVALNSARDVDELLRRKEAVVCDRRVQAQ